MKDQVTIYYTSDVHGYLFPTSYGDTQEKPMGLLNCISQFQKDGNTLIFDGGDTLQGSPMASYIEAKGAELSEADPFALVYNTAGYDAVVPGNHDFNFGYDRLSRYFNALSGQCLCANAKDLGGKTNLKKSHIFTLENGLRIGVAGIVTDYVNVWEQPEHLKQIQITDAFQAAKEELSALKKECDVTICIYHGGYECDLNTGEVLSTSSENAGYRILKELDYDLLLTAHQHMPVAGREISGTHTLQLIPNAVQYAKVQITVENGNVFIESAICPAGNFHEKEPYKSLLFLEEKVQKWLDVSIGQLQTPIPEKDKLSMAMYGSGVADLFNQIQLAYSGADISCVGLGNTPMSLPAHVTMRDLVRVYPFSNTLVVLSLDEEILKRALERCAQYFTIKNDGAVEISDVFLNPKIEHYNYDYFAGITYEIDLHKPVGSRVRRILFKGKPLDGRRLTLCMSDYRASGTGGYEGYKTCEIVTRISREVPELALEYLKKHPIVEVRQNGGIVFCQ